jgi:hypothetical protein
VRKYVTPGSVRIYGLPDTDNSFGVRDNGAGQLWSATEKVGSINYWTGLVVLDKKYLPKVGFWDTLLLLLGQKSLRQLPNVSSEFDVTDLDEANTMHFSKSSCDDNPIAGSVESLIRPREAALADAFRQRNSGNHRAK